ncbi:MAG: bifunctional diaminohydroxyphosphoribosylaminopyrimidine deaminase/5-amino-6-(5-phosphoribosylamino)uracil reductase RibD [Candidimonas sp.]|nr:MAG: bifunctional diaminohydroxyphosphoribosylaminopyrimidine deaminase/5-amino-6-(5-phosphoribosylamino)uracil reductase RibD [Candidimonas sp.]
MSEDDSRWMRRAIALATEVVYLTSPNPRVGCVIVRDGRVLGVGATQAVGGPHAEVMALRDLHRRGGNAAGATVYVTLEPCSHYGHTPPCVDALIAERPGRVVVAMSDPNPLVGGRGLAKLRAAGIAVSTSVCTEEALALNPGFVARMVRQTPWVWLKLAGSLDGHGALNNGVSQWITGLAARTDGHHWRARSDVVLTGMGTILADDPRLDVRLVRTPRQPVRAVVDPRFEFPEQARLLGGGPVWLFTARTDDEKAARLATADVTVVTLPLVDAAEGMPPAEGGHRSAAVEGDRAGRDEGPCRVDLAEMLRWMARREVNEVHVEAGPGLSGALLEAGCVDELLVYLAPVLLGDARPLVRLPALDALARARRFEFFDSARVGEDIRLRARLATRWKALLDAVRPSEAPPVSSGSPLH